MSLYKGESINTKKKAEHYSVRPYLPSPTLVKAVQLAQILKRPLLIKGEPGCGKSKLAEAIAIEFFGKDYKYFYFEWNIKSNSVAQDGLYRIDNLQRLSDANIKSDTTKDLSIRLLPKGDTGMYEDEGYYITLGALGKAFQLSKMKGLTGTPVVLIDEIDKADIDFPNDLLQELDTMKFDIPEAEKVDGKVVTIEADEKMRPLFIITSNDEKPLPPAFLRRCLFHYIDFSEIKLEEIVATNYPDLGTNLTTDAVDVFKKWREAIALRGTSNKNISTSELLDWITLIDHYKKEDVSDPVFNVKELPIYHQALLKDVESIQQFAKKETPVPAP